MLFSITLKCLGVILFVNSIVILFGGTVVL